MARTELPGGVRVLTERVPGVRSVALGIWIGIGSRDERPDQAGAAHYLEHLLFKGTGRRSAQAIAEEMDAVGGELNAFTAKEHTCYYAQVLDEDLPLALDILADVVTNAQLALTDVELERGVVLEEIAMRDDDPEDLLGELFDATLLAGHPLGLPVIGSEESIRGMSRDTLHDFWRGEYTAPRTVVAAAGNLDHGHLTEMVAKAFGDVPEARPVAPRPGGSGLIAARKALALRPDGSEQAHLMLGMPGLDRHDPRRAVLQVLNAAVGGGLSSRLFQEVRERRGLAYQVYSSHTGYSDAGTFGVYAGCAPERLGEVVGVVRDVLAGVAAEGITEAEVLRAKGSMRGGLVLGLEDTGSKMNRLGRSELDHGRQRTISASLASIDAVTPAQVAALAAELLSQPLTGAVVGPYETVDDLPAALHDLA